MILGKHVEISFGFSSAPAYGNSIGCKIIQIFTGSPKMLVVNRRDEDELIAFGKNLEKHDMLCVIHGPYTINLCHPPGSSLQETAKQSILNDLYNASTIGSRCIGSIIHMGKNVPKLKMTIDEALKTYAENIDLIIEDAPYGTLILETGAHQGTEVGSSMEDLFVIYQYVKNKDRIAFCIDTCHIWAAGYEINSAESVREFFTKFDDYFGMDSIACIHFNDSIGGCNSRVDRHADIGYGTIGLVGLAEVAQIAKDNNIPIVMETPLNETTFAETKKKVMAFVN